MSSPSVCVADANVLIDLHAGGLLWAAFRLPFSWVTSDLVVSELEEPDGQTLVARGLERVGLAGPQVQEVFQLAGQYRRVSVYDLSALVLARTLQATLLTGDKHLRRIAEREEVPVHGILWILDEIVQTGVVTPSIVAVALERMLESGSRLPGAECRRRLRRWSSW